MAVVLILGSVARTAAGDETDVIQRSREYEKNIAELQASGHEYPPALLAQINYAVYLSKQRQDHCAAHLDQADDLRRRLESEPATSFVLPDGEARLAQLRYLIASGRAQCTRDKDANVAWVRKARSAAQEVIALYGNLHEYLNMAVMQFNLAEEDRRAGNRALALDELRSALEMDQRYGLRDDATENLRYLGQWQGQETSDAQVAEQMNTFADRTVIPRFAWRPATSSATYVHTMSRMSAGKLSRTTINGTVSETVSEEGGELLESSSIEDLHSMATNNGKKTPDVDAAVSALVSKLFQKAPSVRLSVDGKFLGLDHVKEFIDSATASLRALPDQLLPVGDPKRAALEREVNQRIRWLGNGQSMTEMVRHDFELNTGMWIGVALTQGDWRHRTMLLPVPGMPQVSVDQDVSYGFAAWVPCADGGSEARCIELLARAEPTDTALQDMRDNAAKQGAGKVAYWGVTRVRLVVDPRTLRAHSQETTRYVYMSVENGDKHETETSVSSTIYVMTSQF